MLVDAAATFCQGARMDAVYKYLQDGNGVGNFG